MRNKLTVIIAFFFSGIALAQNDSLNMSKLGHWAVNDTTTYYNDVWGFNINNRDVAILGSNHSTHFLDVTNPKNIEEIASFEGNDLDVVWRDFKVKGNYAYGVADGGDNSLQIFDISKVPTTITKIYDDQEFTTSCHNIFIDKDRLYLASNYDINGDKYSLQILSIADPTTPVHLGYVPSAYFDGNGIHDVYVKNDTAFCSGEWGGMYILDLIDIENPSVISSITTYPNQGYNHSSWVSEDSKYLVMADEVPNSMALKLFDISTLSQPELLDTFRSSTGARPHNPFIRQNKIIISYYFDGVQVFDIGTDGKDVQQTAFYDTYPENDTLAIPFPDEFDGCWGVYPFLPSAKILGSDITHGLFVLGTDEIKADSSKTSILDDVEKNFEIKYLYDKILVDFSEKVTSVQLCDINGRIVFKEKNVNSLEFENSKFHGIYVLNYMIRSKTYQYKLLFK